MKKYDQIHETVMKDILDIMDTVIDLSDEGLESIVKKYKNRKTIRSIARASNDLICVFPVLSSMNIAIENQAMNTKAIEKNCVSMLQILFSAIQLSDATTAYEYLQNFHTNINKSAKLFDIDDIIGISDGFNEGALIQEGTKPSTEIMRLVREDMRNLGYVLDSDVNPVSISEGFTCRLDPSGKYIAEVQIRNLNEAGKKSLEARNKRLEYENRVQADKIKGLEDIKKAQAGSIEGYKNAVKNRTDKINALQKENKKKDFEINKLRTDGDIQSGVIKDLRKENERYKSEEETIKREMNKSTIEKNRMEVRKSQYQIAKTKHDMISTQVLNTDYKKANELQPTLMVVNFKSRIGDDYETVESVVIGVKAKLYPTSSEDIITHVVAKAKDANWVTKLIKATTREISFFKDFVFAIDKAKIDALSLSRKGSANKMWKVLERRGVKSRFNRLFGRTNDATAITTLMVSQAEVDYMKKNFQVDISDTNVARNLLEQYNFLGIVIVDESLEVSKFMWDTGEDTWEVISFTNLERESNDNTYKKVVNLMTKMA